MSDLDHLLYWRGISGEYLNYKGESVQVPLENRLRLLTTMGVDVSDPALVAKASFELDIGPWMQFFPPLQTYRLDPSGGFYINIAPEAEASELQWELVNQHGELVENGACILGDAPEIGNYIFKSLRYTRRLIRLELATPGYYQLKVTLVGDTKKNTTTPGESGSGILALAPKTVYQPQWLNKGDRPWGFIVQLYTLRSKADWGMGDLGDLKMLVEYAAKIGADLIGLNPLHALLPDVENYCSPYSPSDRRFISPLYIDLASIDDYQNAEALHMQPFIELRERALQSLREASEVDYTAVKNLKYRHFEEMFRTFCSIELSQDSKRYKRFKEFMHVCGAALKQFALYEAAKNRWEGCSFLADIPEDALAALPDSNSFTAVFTANQQAVLFHCYLQWLAHEQLEECQQTALHSGMKLGLVRDLAVGADGGGAEVLSNPQQFCCGASVGAPPDPLAEQGQNWGLPPMDPAYLRSTGFKHFIQILRENMSRCGALRIDHAMSLMRLWWCPPGKTADHGAYVYYPFEDMLALLCLESHLNTCSIIGEDLGVVPHEFREAITEAGIFTNRVFYFEKENYSYFKDPKNYDIHALAMVNNHDVPTLKSWWDGSDLALRDKLNIFEEGVDYQSMLEQRSRDKHEVFNFLAAQGLLPDSWYERNIEQAADKALVYALLVAVSRVSSRIFAIQLEDVLLMDEPVNVPGTYKEHPNWKRKLALELENIFNSQDNKKLFEQIAQQRMSI
ncbi:4-alpha-glucanotransferase [Alteromonadaceae bacterium Bs31]|nr:4-alpha-glucanotransferase [Alteromonadaceae bacterium Bs31]